MSAAALVEVNEAHNILVREITKAAYRAAKEDGAIKVPITVYGCEVYVMKAPGT